MLRVLFRGGFIGGLVALLASFFTTAVFSLQGNAFHGAHQEAELAAQLRASLPEAGVYLLPNTRVAPPEGVDVEAHIDAMVERLAAGPVAFIAVDPRGERTHLQAKFYLMMLVHFACALLLTLVGWSLQSFAFRRRFLLLLLAVLAGSGFVLLNQWNQWYFGWEYTGDALRGILATWIPGCLVVAWATGAGRRFVGQADPGE